MSFPKRSAEDFKDDQGQSSGGKRQKGDNDAMSTSSPTPPPTSVVLSSKEHYIVEIEGLGRLNLKDNWFRSSGGSNAGFKLNDAVFMAKVSVSDSHGTQIFCRGGGQDKKLVSIRRNQEDGTTTVALQEPNNNKVVGNTELPGYPVEIQISRDEVVNVHGIQSVTITAGNGGHVVHSGCGLVWIEGNVQSVNLHGTGSVRINGDVEEGLNLGGLGYMVVYGNVRGDIQVNGVSSLTVFGKHLGKGNLSKGWLAKVRILDELEQDKGRENDAPKPEAVEAPQGEEDKKGKDKTEYDDFHLEEIVMDIMSDDEE